MDTLNSKHMQLVRRNFMEKDFEDVTVYTFLSKSKDNYKYCIPTKRDFLRNFKVGAELYISGHIYIDKENTYSIQRLEYKHVPSVKTTPTLFGDTLERFEQQVHLFDIRQVDEKFSMYEFVDNQYKKYRLFVQGEDSHYRYFEKGDAVFLKGSIYKKPLADNVFEVTDCNLTLMGHKMINNYSFNVDFTEERLLF